jgi:hypothetical protein
MTKPPKPAFWFFIVEEDGFVYGWSCRSTRTDCVKHFCRDYAPAGETLDWEHFKKRGYRCKKLLVSQPEG